MGFVFVPYSARGHVTPMLRVVAELTARGERVQVIANGRYRHAVEAAGAGVVVPEVEYEPRVPAGYTPRDLLDRGRSWQRRRAAAPVFLRTFEQVVRGDESDVFVIDPHVRAIGAAVDRLGCSAVRFWTTRITPVRAVRGPTLVNALPEFQPGRERFGPDVCFVGPLVGGLHTPDDAEIDWAAVVRPVLLVSPGTVFARSAEFFLAVIRAFAGSQWTVVIATGRLPVEALGSVPDNIVVRQWIPQSQALRYADVFLTHAGMNSVHEAMVAAVPMLLAPRSFEQRLNASRVADLGLGGRLSAGRRLGPEVERLAGDRSIKANLRRMSRRAATARGAVRAADRLCDMAVGRSSG